MLVQLHWQHRLEHGKTIFLAQDEVNEQRSASDVLERFGEIIQQRRQECPEDYGPMVCDERCEYFSVAPHALAEG